MYIYIYIYILPHTRINKLYNEKRTQIWTALSHDCNSVNVAQQFLPTVPAPLFMSSKSILSIRPSATKRGIKLRQSGKISPQEASNGEN